MLMLATAERRAPFAKRRRVLSTFNREILKLVVFLQNGRVLLLRLLRGFGLVLCCVRHGGVDVEGERIDERKAQKRINRMVSN